jgi:hypothetical protein
VRTGPASRRILVESRADDYLFSVQTEGMVGAVQLPERCYTMDAKGDLLVVGTAERKVQMYDRE